MYRGYLQSQAPPSLVASGEEAAWEAWCRLGSTWSSKRSPLKELPSKGSAAGGCQACPGPAGHSPSQVAAWNLGHHPRQEVAAGKKGYPLQDCKVGVSGCSLHPYLMHRQVGFQGLFCRSSLSEKPGPPPRVCNQYSSLERSPPISWSFRPPQGFWCWCWQQPKNKAVIRNLV